MVIASEPWAIAKSLNENTSLSERAIASYFALDVLEDGQSLFENVFELLPAHWLKVNSSSINLQRYWKPKSPLRVRNKSDEEYAEEFRSVLEESVKCRLRSVTPAGILMSGGLDSTSIACLAARLVTPATLPTVSYVFDELPDCDERVYINAVQKLYSTRSIQIPCDAYWPYKDGNAGAFNPNEPDRNCYRPLSEYVYSQIQSNNLTVMLTGGFGDDLYLGWIDWFWDLFVDRRYSQLAQEFGYLAKHSIVLKSLRTGGLRRAGRRFVNVIPGGKHIGRKANPPAWLTPYSINLLGIRDSSIEKKPHSQLLDYQAASATTSEIPVANRHRLELRHPYRDQRLIEYAMSLPAYQLHMHGQTKRILRTAMKGILPETIRTRRKPTGLYSLLDRGIKSEKPRLQSFISNSNVTWTKYVNSQWLQSRWDNSISFENDGPETLIFWNCYSFEHWKNDIRLV